MPAAFDIAHAKRRAARLRGAKLGDEITELCGYIHAATYRLLVLIREFDEGGHWQEPGLCSCAHWLNFKCGIGMNAAREKLRVAHALAGLPNVSAAFEKGELSYSKARAMTRIANKDNEDYLLMIARHGTAYHVEKLVSKYRRARRLQDAAAANEQHAHRELSYHYDDDGSLVISARLPAEQGALVVRALEKAMEKATDRRFPAADVSAETPERVPVSARRADAIAEVAETYLGSDDSHASTADRYQVIVHVSAETLAAARADDDDGTAGVSAETSLATDLSHIEHGPHVSAETSRRIACDCSMIAIKEGENGQPLSIGRRSRAIPPSIRRALRIRDDGCRFPGCTHTRFVDGHHVRHWADGGETSLDNLVQLCRHHHRLVHEGGYVCERTASGDFAFRTPAGVKLPVAPAPRRTAGDGDLRAWLTFDDPDTEIDANTCVPMWRAGEGIDWTLAVGHLFV